MSDWVDIASIAAVADAEEVGHAARDIKEVLDLVGHWRGHRQNGVGESDQALREHEIPKSQESKDEVGSTCL